jgi:hypothetical protein
LHRHPFRLRNDFGPLTQFAIHGNANLPENGLNFYMINVTPHCGQRTFFRA